MPIRAKNDSRPLLILIVSPPANPLTAGKWAKLTASPFTGAKRSFMIMERRPVLRKNRLREKFQSFRSWGCLTRRDSRSRARSSVYSVCRNKQSGAEKLDRGGGQSCEKDCRRQ